MSTNQQHQSTANGSLYSQALGRVVEERERYMRAVRQEGTDAENQAAWHDFSALVTRAIQSGRLWAPEIVHFLAPLLYVVTAEQEELQRVKEALNAVGDDEVAAKRICAQDSCPGMAAFSIVDPLADALGVSRDEMRRKAGYLSEVCQPSDRH